jgi:hypothetical protein
LASKTMAQTQFMTFQKNKKPRWGEQSSKPHFQALLPSPTSKSEHDSFSNL